MIKFVFKPRKTCVAFDRKLKTPGGIAVMRFLFSKMVTYGLDESELKDTGDEMLVIWLPLKSRVRDHSEEQLMAFQGIVVSELLLSSR